MSEEFNLHMVGLAKTKHWTGVCNSFVFNHSLFMHFSGFVGVTETNTKLLLV